MATDLIRFSFILSLFILLPACGEPGLDSLGKPNALWVFSRLDRAQMALGQDRCSEALDLLLPLYESDSSSNEIRLAMGSAYGCFAKIKIFSLISDIITEAGNLQGAGFWQFLVKEFPSQSTPVDDGIPLSAHLGLDAVMSAVDRSTPLQPGDWIEQTGFNPRVFSVNHRLRDANTYMTFLAMASMGSLLSRAGLPDSNFERTAALPWVDPANTAGEGCAFASSLLLFLDGVSYLAAHAPSALASGYSQMESYLQLGLDAACAVGCFQCQLAGSPVTCSSCPNTLRDRASCAGLNTDLESCAASGLAAFANLAWPGTP